MENYLSANLKFLRKAKGLNQSQMAEIIGKKKSIIGPYENGDVEPDIETLQKLSNYFGIDVSKLLGIDLSKEGNNVYPNVYPSVYPNSIEPQEKYTKKVYTEPRVIEHIIDTSGHLQIPIVDVKAAAGPGYINSEHLTADDVIRMPAHLVKSGHHLCIRIKGTSMAPTLQDGGYAIIRLLERSEWLHMPSERIYLVVDNDGKTAIKRVKNRFSGEKGFIVLSSDSPDKSSHPTYNLHPEEIAFIWYVEWYFTAKMPNVHDQYYNRVSQLQDSVDQLSEEVRSIKKQLK
jgi:transcriptional regulator with XRE-family HTH domain